MAWQALVLYSHAPALYCVMLEVLRRYLLAWQALIPYYHAPTLYCSAFLLLLLQRAIGTIRGSAGGVVEVATTPHTRAPSA
eukprot:6210526-Pleurochrysis_carterae.AAC.3